MITIEDVGIGAASTRGKAWSAARSVPEGGRPAALLSTLMYPSTGQVRDVDGILWDVSEVRATKHGFDLYFGKTKDDRRFYCGGPGKLIVTDALWYFWFDTRTTGSGSRYDLPATPGTLMRARKRHGFHTRNDAKQFWIERSDDLNSLPIRAFAAIHGVNPYSAKSWRYKLRGKPARESGGPLAKR